MAQQHRQRSCMMRLTAAVLVLLVGSAALLPTAAAAEAEAEAGAPTSSSSSIEPPSDEQVLTARLQVLLNMAARDTPAAAEWAAANLRQGLSAGASGEAVGSIFRALSYTALIWVPIAGGAVFMLSVLVHVIARRCLRRQFAALDLEQRLVSYQHMLFAIVFGLQVVPYTVLLYRLLFVQWTTVFFGSSAAGGQFSEIGFIIGLITMSHAFLYCMEGGLRCMVKPNLMLMVHHFLFFVLLACGLWMGPNALLVKMTVVLDLGAVHEVPLYVSLLAYRWVWVWVWSV